jgi:predicted transcriptional regulator
MLEAILGSATKEKILIFIVARESGYARQITDFFSISLTAVIKQLKNLEEANILFAEMQGRTKIYRFNKRFPFLKELRLLLEKALEFYPEEIIKKLKYNRKRPRRSDKPL